jgi:hypothetical protein
MKSPRIQIGKINKKEWIDTQLATAPVDSQNEVPFTRTISIRKRK